MEYGKPWTKDQIEYFESEIIDKIEKKFEMMSHLRNNIEAASAHLDDIDHDIDILYRMQMLIKGLKNNEP